MQAHTQHTHTHTHLGFLEEKGAHEVVQHRADLRVRLQVLRVGRRHGRGAPRHGGLERVHGLLLV